MEPEDFVDDEDRQAYEDMCFEMDAYPYCYCCTCCGHDCYDEEPYDEGGEDDMDLWTDDEGGEV